MRLIESDDYDIVAGAFKTVLTVCNVRKIDEHKKVHLIAAEEISLGKFSSDNV